MALVYRTLQGIDVYADSGYWQDIQNAVDECNYASGGHGGNVHIPEGTFNFVNVGESWDFGWRGRVSAPAGINFYGAPTERDAKGQVVKWKTILNMPWEVPTTGPDNTPVWFSVTLDESDPSKTFRFSDIKLVGWRFFDHNSITQYIGVKAYIAPYWPEGATAGMTNIRVDHCHFQDMCGQAISLGPSGDTIRNRRSISGVVDHNRIVNSAGVPEPWSSRTVCYGVAIGRWASDYWDYDIRNILGKYTNYTVFIEDNYFSKWRHCVASNHGVHYVFRHNTLEYDFGTPLDCHGSYAGADHPYAVGTRAVEIYDNLIISPVAPGGYRVMAFRGGAGVFFNNTIIGYASGVELSNDGGNFEPYCPQCRINQSYFWGNTFANPIIGWTDANTVLNVNYFLRAPNLAQDGFEYTPYPYPHPLTLEEAPPPPPETVTPWLSKLEEGTYKITMPQQVQVGSDTYKLKQWEDGSTNPTRTINLTADMAITTTYEAEAPPPPPPPGKGYLDIHAFLNGQEIVVPYEITETAATGNTPQIVEVDPGTYTITATLGTETKTEIAQVLESQTVRVDFKFEVLPTPPIAIVPVVSATAGLILTGIAIS